MKYGSLLLMAAITFFMACNSNSQTPAEKEESLSLAEQYDLKRIKLEEKYDFIDTFSVEDGIAVVFDKDSQSYGYIDSSGKVIVPIENSFAAAFSDGLGLVGTKDGKNFFVDKTGKKVLDLPQYKNVFPFYKGYATVMNSQEEFGLINKKGEEVIPCMYEEGLFNLSDTLFSAKDKSQLKTVIGLHNKPLFAQKFLSVYFDEDSKQFFGQTDEKNWSIFDYNGKELKKLGNIGVNPPANGVISVNRYNSEGVQQKALMNIHGDMIVDWGKYDNIDNLPGNDGIIRVSHDSTDGKGNVVTDSEGYYYQRVGYIDVTGKEIVPLVYDAGGDFSEGLAMINVHDSLGYIDKTGKLVIPRIFKKGKAFRNGHAKVEYNDELYYIDKKGKQVGLANYF